MKFTALPFKSAWLVTVLMGWLAAPGVAWAQSEPVQIEVVGPRWSLYTAEDVWFERQASVSNRTDQAKQLRLSYLSSVGSKQVAYTRLFEVPPHAERMVKMAVYPQGLKPTGQQIGQLKLPGISESFFLSDVQHGQDFPPYIQPRPKIAGVTPICRIGGSDDEASGSPRFVKLMSGVFNQYVVMQPKPITDAPDCWYGYSLTALVLMGDEALDRMRPSQTQALLDHVRRGGVLLITANENLGRMLRGPIAQAAGVSVVGYHKVVSLDLPEPKGKTTVNLDKPIVLAELCPDQAAVVFSAGDLPLLTKRQFGKGWVFVLAVPLLSANDTVLREVQAARNLQPLLNESEFVAPAKAVLGEIEGRPGPKRIVPTAILLGLGALVLAGGVMAKFKGRGELVWLVLAPATLLLAVAMQLFGLTRGAPEPWLSHVGMVWGLGDGRARVQEVFAYGSPKRQDVTLHADTPSGVISDIGVSGGLGAKQEVRSGGTMSLPDQVVEPNATRAFFVDEVKSVGDVQARLTFGPKGLMGTISNGLGEGLADAVVYVNGRTFALGNLKAASDKPAEVALGRENLLGNGEFTADMLHYELKNRLLRQIQVQPAPGRSVNRQVLLIASMNSSMLKPVDASGMGRQGWSVVVWPLSIDPPAAGGKVLLPPGFVETQIRQGQVWAYIRGPISGSGVSQIGLRAILPPQIRSLDQASAHITLRLRASNYAMTISRIGPDGKPGEVIKKVDNPTGIVQVDVPQLDSAGAAGGSFDFVLRLDQIRTGEDNSSQWTLESTDIALEGIAR